MGTTCIRRAAWVIAWDREREKHVYRRDTDVAFDGDTIIYLGPDYPGHADEEFDGRERMVMPGMVNIHCHPSAQAVFRGMTEEFGNPRLFYSGRHRFRQSFEPDADGMRASAAYTLAELLAGGVTTVVDLSHAWPGWLELIEQSGIRACVAPMYRSATWHTDTGQQTLYEWHEDGGQAAFQEAREVMDAAERHPSGLLSAMVAPAQVDTCTEELLRESASLAAGTGRPLHVHAAQSYAEFGSMTRRHDMTPIEWLHGIGFLGKATVIGHAVFTDEHPWLNWPTRRDLALLAATGTSVAHAPTVFARDGTLLHDLGSYHGRGINLGIGTDTHPNNMLEELRWAEILARTAAGPRHSLSTADVFRFATIGGSRILLRDDLGRITEGARSDIVTVDLTHPAMRPLWDPLRSLVYAAGDRPVEHVFVSGRQVVNAGKVLTLDRQAAAAELEAAQWRAAARVPERDPQGLTMDQVAPLSLPVLADGHS